LWPQGGSRCRRDQDTAPQQRERRAPDLPVSSEECADIIRSICDLQGAAFECGNMRASFPRNVANRIIGAPL
jgi:hypothetical protein